MVRPPTSRLLARMASETRFQRDAEGLQLPGIDDDLVLLLEAAHAGDLGDALRGDKVVADDPVLDAPQFGQRALRTEHDILVDPADAACVGTQRGCDALRQSFCCEVQVLQHAGACPIEVGPVVEHHVDEGHAEIRKPPHHLGMRHRQQRSGQRVGDLVLDHLGCLARILGVDDHLRVREVRERVQWRVSDSPHADTDHDEGGEQHQHLVAGGQLDKAADHGLAPCWSAAGFV